MLNLIRRVEIAQAAVDRFQLKPLVYGQADCWRLFAFVMAEAGWPEPVPGLRYSSARGAAAAMRRHGHADLGAAIDARTTLRRVPVAMHLPADIVLMPSDDEMGALGVAVGAERALAFVADGVEPAPFGLAGSIEVALACWRLEECPR